MYWYQSTFLPRAESSVVCDAVGAIFFRCKKTHTSSPDLGNLGAMGHNGQQSRHLVGTVVDTYCDR
jgi:hypothetical protein